MLVSIYNGLIMLGQPCAMKNLQLAKNYGKSWPSFFDGIKIKKLTNDAHSGTLMTCQFVITSSVDFTYEII